MTVTAVRAPTEGTVTAVLGPTNTGKTRYAIERMLGRADGVIGLPLRLLAREVYDTIVELRGPGCVALVTGEERIQPARARYFVCTVEAMPLDRWFDFVAIDEIQMCADPERGHIFTDRLLRARGRYETLFLGSDAARARIASLVPDVRFTARERFSTLSFAGSKKISRLKARTAVVAFSIDQVYAIAELIRRQRGGAAVVMGALSPRTRNAQVDLYQQGDVDYLVATDAIGMGLNLDVDHVAFAGLAKFDGHRHRPLDPNELAQIAGRAGRFTRDGTFGVTGEAPPILPEVVEAIEGHRFKPIARLMWRNADLRFGSVPQLLACLDETPGSPDLARAREADDHASLRLAWDDTEIRALATHPDRVRLLWEVCQIPDFRKVASTDHMALVSQIYRFLLAGPGVIPSDWIAGQVRRIDRVDGDIDALSKRLAYIRTWTFVANRSAWVQDSADWQARTRAVEDRLSDALHHRLTQRFVDRRTSVLLRRLKQKERLVAEVNDKGEVTVEGEFLGRIDGFRFIVDETATPDELKTLRSASLGALQGELARRADRLYLTPDTEIDVTEQGGLMWGTDAIGKLVRGDELLSPRVEVFVDDNADPAVREKVERRLTHWMSRKVAALFEPIVKMRDDEAVTGLARGVAFRLGEEMGVIPRRQIADDIKALGQEERALLRKHGVRFGQHTIFLPLMLKPAPTRMRLLLWALWEQFEEFPSAPPPGQVTIAAIEGVPQGFYEKSGYRLCGSRALRIDMLERLADMIRPHDTRSGFEASADMLSITGCTLEQFADIMQGLGFAAERGERPKTQRPAARTTPSSGPDSAAAGADDAPSGEPASEATVAASAADADEASELRPDGAALPDTAAPTEGGETTVDQPVAAEPAASNAQPTVVVSDEIVAEPATEALSDVDAGTPIGAEGEPAAPVSGESDAQSAPAGAGAPHVTASGPLAESDVITPAEQTPAPSGSATGVDTEVFYTFTQRPRRPQGQGRRRGAAAGAEAGAGEATRGPRRGPGRRGGKTAGGQAAQAAQAGGGPAQVSPDEDHKGKGGKPRGKGPRPPRDGAGPKRLESKPRRDDRPVDPDSPFAVLQKLKTK